MLFSVSTWDACPQHISQRIDAADVSHVLAGRHRRIHHPYPVLWQGSNAMAPRSGVDMGNLPAAGSYSTPGFKRLHRNALSRRNK
jgi:hypothetical protein